MRKLIDTSSEVSRALYSSSKTAEIASREAVTVTEGRYKEYKGWFTDTDVLVIDSLLEVTSTLVLH